MNHRKSDSGIQLSQSIAKICQSSARHSNPCAKHKTESGQWQPHGPRRHFLELERYRVLLRGAGGRLKHAGGRTSRRIGVGSAVHAGRCGLIADREGKAVAARVPYFHFLDETNDAGELHSHSTAVAILDAYRARTGCPPCDFP